MDVAATAAEGIGHRTGHRTNRADDRAFAAPLEAAQRADGVLAWCSSMVGISRAEGIV